MEIPDNISEALAAFKASVDVPEPALDQAYTAMREVFRTLGVGEITSDQARFGLSVLMLYLAAPEESRVVISSYLGTLLDIDTGKE